MSDASFKGNKDVKTKRIKPPLANAAKNKANSSINVTEVVGAASA